MFLSWFYYDKANDFLTENRSNFQTVNIFHSPSFFEVDILTEKPTESQVNVQIIETLFLFKCQLMLGPIGTNVKVLLTPLSLSPLHARNKLVLHYLVYSFFRFFFPTIPQVEHYNQHCKQAKARKPKVSKRIFFNILNIWPKQEKESFSGWWGILAHSSLEERRKRKSSWVFSQG